MKKFLVIITIVLGALFACTVDSMFDHPFPLITGGLFILFLVIDFCVISRDDMEKIFYDDNIK